MIETIEIREAVRRLADFFARGDIVFTNHRREWRMMVTMRHDGDVPDWIMAAENGGHTRSAVRVALEDMIVSVMEGDIDAS